MADWRELGDIWTTFKELDIRPIRDQAERPIVLAFVGAAGVGKSTSIAALRRDKRAREKVISSLANATYSIGTGLAEVIPALNIPFNVADMMILADLNQDADRYARG